MRQLGTATLLLCLFTSGVLSGQSRTARARDELGAKLFRETELNNPGSDFPQSCNGCHFFGEDPRGAGHRFYSDTLERSLLPGMSSAAPKTTLRNTPTLLDTNLMERFNHDGRYTSIEDLLRDKLSSSSYGWGPDDRERAYDTIHQTLIAAMLVDYGELFERAYHVDLDTVTRDEAVTWAVTALADYLDTITSEQTSTWDAFSDMNRIPPGPSSGEDPKHYAGRIQGRIGNQEGRVLIKRPLGFSSEAYEGFKTFFRVEGDRSVGNCVSCHMPPRFSDFLFHNTGIAQVDYDQANGDGAFADLEIPGPDAVRPQERFLADPRSGEGRADLGYWNFLDLDATGEPEGASEAERLEASIGAFKTPVLRNLKQTGPYMHNGIYETIEDTVREIVRINRLARAGKMRAIDPDYVLMNLGDEDVIPLTRFLESFDEVDVDQFRELLINLEE